MTTYELLVSAKALIEDPAHWTQGAFARDVAGTKRAYASRAAVCFCSFGALRLAMAATPRLAMAATPAENALCAAELDNAFAGAFANLEKFTGGRTIVEYNDNNTHEEVMAWWDKAIACAKETSAQ